jgi:nucleotide-binding universal stress UspA family protein
MVVIAAVDRSDRAEWVAQEAQAIANAFDDSLHVVHVLSQSTFVELERTSVQKTGTAIDPEQIRDHAKQTAAKATAELDVDAVHVGLVGNAAEEVIDYAEDHDARFVVLGPRKRSPAGKALFGSTAQSVMLQADCSVVAVSTQKE